MVKNKSDSEPTVQQIHNTTERRASIETIPNPLHRYKNYLELLFFFKQSYFLSKIFNRKRLSTNGHRQGQQD